MGAVWGGGWCADLTGERWLGCESVRDVYRGGRTAPKRKVVGGLEGMVYWGLFCGFVVHVEGTGSVTCAGCCPGCCTCSAGPCLWPGRAVEEEGACWDLLMPPVDSEEVSGVAWGQVWACEEL